MAGFDEAWAALKPLLLVPVAETAAPVVETKAAAATAVQAEAVRAAQPAAVPSGLSNVDTFNNAIADVPSVAAVAGVRLTIDGKVQIMDLKTWERQSSDFQKRVLRSSSANVRAIDALYEQQQQERAARRARR